MVEQFMALKQQSAAYWEAEAEVAERCSKFEALSLSNKLDKMNQ